MPVRRGANSRRQRDADESKTTLTNGIFRILDRWFSSTKPDIEEFVEVEGTDLGTPGADWMSSIQLPLWDETLPFYASTNRDLWKVWLSIEAELEAYLELQTALVASFQQYMLDNSQDTDIWERTITTNWGDAPPDVRREWSLYELYREMVEWGPVVELVLGRMKMAMSIVRMESNPGG